MNEPYYKDALKLAQKEYRTCVQQGKPTSLPVLDELVSSTAISKGVDLGVLQVPAEFIIGTKTKGRVAAFATNFMPILDEESEFADKWKRLCEAHLNEGIREPIKAYEYMNRYYVEEGNKRVSVLKFFDAITIPAHVIRVMPEHTGEDVDIYLEYIEFYKYSKINFLEFSKKGCYNALLKAMGKAPNEEWTDDERNEFSGIYYYFSKAYTKNGGDKLSSTIGDALLSYIQIYGFHDLRSTDTAVIKKNLSKMWEEVELHSEEEPIEVKTDPPEEKRQTVIEKVLSGVTPQPKAQPLKVAFIHDGNPDKSGWINDHEKGRRYVDRVFAEKIETKAYYDAMAGDPLMIIEQAIGDGAKLVFTTSPRLTQASLRAAVEHPDIYIMNCSLNRSHRYISCYYTRMYEAKFILGAIAGSLTKSDKIGYVCDYPIYGQIAQRRCAEAGRAGHPLYFLTGHRTLPRRRQRELRSLLYQRRASGADCQPRLEMGRLLRGDPPPRAQQNDAGGVRAQQQGAQLLLGHVRRRRRRGVLAMADAALQALRQLPERRHREQRLHAVPDADLHAGRRKNRLGRKAGAGSDHRDGLSRRKRRRHHSSVRGAVPHGQGGCRHVGHRGGAEHRFSRR